jgi:hypothetical protein
MLTSIIAVALLHAGASGSTCMVRRMYYAIGPGKLGDVILSVAAANGTDVLFNPGIFEHFDAEVAGVGGYYTAAEAFEAAIGTENVHSDYRGDCIFIYLKNEQERQAPIPNGIPRAHARRNPLQRNCDCWVIDGTLGTPWCTLQDEGTLGIDESCRKRRGHE